VSTTLTGGTLSGDTVAGLTRRHLG
jgi:hypothetical protein